MTRTSIRRWQARWNNSRRRKQICTTSSLRTARTRLKRRALDWWWRNSTARLTGRLVPCFPCAKAVLIWFRWKAAADQIKQIAENAAHATNDQESIRAQDAAYTKAQTSLAALTKERDELRQQLINKDFAAATLPDAITARIVELADPPVQPSSPDKKIATAAFVSGGIVAGLGLALLALLNTKPRGAEKKAA